MTGPEEIGRFASLAEELGYDTIMVSDHVVLPVRVESRYPYNSSGLTPLNAENDIFEPFTLMSYLAAITQRVRLGISVQVVPYRHPVLNAKMLTTLDVLSAGRIIVGVGVGWMKEEFQVLDADYDNRGTVTDEHIEIFRVLCTEEDPSYHGQHYNFEGVKLRPKPVQKPHPPVWVGGNSAPARRRAALLGDGWHAVGLCPEEMTMLRSDVLRRRAEAGMPTASFVTSVLTTLQFTDEPLPQGRTPMTGNTQQIIDDVKRYQGAGVDLLPLSPWVDFEVVCQQIERFATEVMLRV